MSQADIEARSWNRQNINLQPMTLKIISWLVFGDDVILLSQKRVRRHQMEIGGVAVKDERAENLQSVQDCPAPLPGEAKPLCSVSQINVIA